MTVRSVKKLAAFGNSYSGAQIQRGTFGVDKRNGRAINETDFERQIRGVEKIQKEDGFSVLMLLRGLDGEESTWKLVFRVFADTSVFLTRSLRRLKVEQVVRKQFFDKYVLQM